MKKILFILFLIFVMSGMVSAAANIDPDLLTRIDNDPDKSYDVIITMLPNKPFPDLKVYDGEIMDGFKVINACFAKLPGKKILDFANKEENVISLTWNKEFKAMLDIAVPAIGADRLWAIGGYTGSGVTIAIIDTGINAEPDFQQRIVSWIDYINGTSYPYDDNGHGTYVAGCAAGNGAVVAPAYQAYLMGAKVLDRHGSGSLNDILSGMEWAILNGADVLNMSLGGTVTQPPTYDPMCMMCQEAWDRGIVVVAAAGSSYPIPSPGRLRDIITVATSDDRGTITVLDDILLTNNQLGPTLFDYYVKPDVVAPGVNITARGIGGYVTGTGSSASTAIVSGVVAQLIQSDPTLVPQQIKNKLLLTSYELIGGTYRRFIEGEGLINVFYAFSF